MGVCLNKNSLEYLTLFKMSGLPEFDFNSFVSEFYGKFKRFPNLDEIPNADSSNYVRNQLKVFNIDNTDFIDNDYILLQTGSKTLQEAVIKLNNKYRDLEISLVELSKSSIIKIRKRPDRWNDFYLKNISIDKTISDLKTIGVFNSVLEKLANLYGINFIPITNEELGREEWNNIIPDAKSTNAFVYNGNVYINIDNSSIDAPLHEMLHIFLGSIRFSDPKLYKSLVDLMNDIPNKLYDSLVYYDRTNSDINEELLVTNFSKFLTLQDSIFNELPPEKLLKIFYEMGRVVDTVLFGKQSAFTIHPIDLYNNSLIELSEKLGSVLLNNNFSGSLDVKSALVHRILANVKSDLIKSKQLQEYCS